MDTDPAGTSITLQLILMVILTMTNAYFAASEMAIVSVNKGKIKRLAQDGNKKARLVEQLMDAPTNFLSTIQIAITLSGFFNSASAATGISSSLAEVLQRWGIPQANTIAVVLITMLISFITLIFGELVPKRMAIQKAESFSMFCAKPILIISKVAYPIIKILSVSTTLVLRLFGIQDEDVEESLSREEIRSMLEDSREKGVLDEAAAEMMDGVFEFDEILANEIMTPRTQVFCIDIDDPKDAYVHVLMEMQYSRIPVYEESIDNVIGILNIKDYFTQAYQHGFAFVDIRKILRKPYFVPETKNIDDLFQEMQKLHQHIAILIDEYGGMSGIVTMEDLVEEIMGEIEDEYDDAQAMMLRKLYDDVYEINGRMPIEDLNEALQINIENEKYDTIGGFILDQLGCIPEDGESGTLYWNGIQFQMLEIRNHRIERIRVELPKQKEE